MESDEINNENKFEEWYEKLHSRSRKKYDRIEKEINENENKIKENEIKAMELHRIMYMKYQDAFICRYLSDLNKARNVVKKMDQYKTKFLNEVKWRDEQIGQLKHEIQSIYNS